MNSKGITLLEMLICFVLLGIIVQVMSGLLVQSARSQAKLQAKIDQANKALFAGYCVKLTPNGNSGNYKVQKENCQ